MGLLLWLVGGHPRLVGYRAPEEPTLASAKFSHINFWDEQSHKQADGSTGGNGRGIENKKLSKSFFIPTSDSGRTDGSHYPSWKVAVATNQPLQRRLTEF